jgi:hypothetical protein
MLGELGADGPELVERAIAICPAVDLKTGALFIARPENWFFQKYYVDCLLEIAERKRKILPDYPMVNFPNPLSLYDFDENYTAPLCGFKNADDYYCQSSANRVISQITVPTTILYSLDDPVVPAETITSLELPKTVTAYVTEYGGHVGYLSWVNGAFGLRWMDSKVISWLFD